MMALAYAVVLASTEMYDHHWHDTVRQAQAAADQKFGVLAREARKTVVTRNPEPRVMSYPEMRNAFPNINLDGLVGLYFTADIS